MASKGKLEAVAQTALSQAQELYDDVNIKNAVDWFQEFSRAK